MSDLPWLLVHGKYAWVAVMALLALAGMVVAWRLPRWRVRDMLFRAHGAMPAAQKTADGFSDGRDVTLIGTLGTSDGASCARFEDGTPAAIASITTAQRWKTLPDAGHLSTTVHAQGLHVSLDDGTRVELEGPFVTLTGTREVLPGRPLRSLAAGVFTRTNTADSMGADVLSSQPVRMVSLARGDRVRVHGRLRQVGGVRGEQGHWTLTPRAHTDAETLGEPLRFLPIAAEPAPGKSVQVRGPSWPSFARFALAGAAVGFVAVTVMGELAYQRFRRRETSLLSLLANDGQAAHSPLALLAASSPFRRADTLQRVLYVLSGMLQPTPRVTHERAGVAELAGECALAFELLSRQNQMDEAIASGLRCGTPESRWLAAEGQYAQADFVAASNTLAGLAEPPEKFRNEYNFTIRAHLLGGDAARVRKIISTAIVLQKKKLEDEGRVVHGPESDFAMAARCLADGLTLRAPGTTRASIDALLVRGKDRWFQMRRCGLLAADALTGMDRIAALDALDRVHNTLPVAWRRLDAMLRNEVTPEHVRSLHLDYVRLRSGSTAVGPDSAALGLLEDASPAIERPLLEKLASREVRGVDAVELRMQLALSMAVFDSYTAHHADALRWARLARHDALVLVMYDANQEQAGQAGLQPGPVSGAATANGPPNDGISEPGPGLMSVDSRVVLATQVLLGTEMRAGERDQFTSFLRVLPENELGATYLRYELEQIESETPEAIVARPLNAQSTPDLFFALGSAEQLRALGAQWEWANEPVCWRCESTALLESVSRQQLAASKLGAARAVQRTQALERLRNALLRRDLAVPLRMAETL